MIECFVGMDVLAIFHLEKGSQKGLGDIFQYVFPFPALPISRIFEKIVRKKYDSLFPMKFLTTPNSNSKKLEKGIAGQAW